MLYPSTSDHASDDSLSDLPPPSSHRILLHTSSTRGGADLVLQALERQTREPAAANPKKPRTSYFLTAHPRTCEVRILDQAVCDPAAPKSQNQSAPLTPRPSLSVTNESAPFLHLAQPELTPERKTLVPPV